MAELATRDVQDAAMTRLYGARSCAELSDGQRMQAKALAERAVAMANCRGINSIAGLKAAVEAGVFAQSRPPVEEAEVLRRTSSDF